MTIAFRRDSFCGKMSACNNLRQYGIPYSHHHAAHRSPGFAGVRQGPAMVRRRLPRGERLPQSARGRDRRASHGVQHGPLQREDSRRRRAFRSRRSTSPKCLGRIERMKDNDDAAQAKLAAIKKYVDSQRRARRCPDEDGQAGRRHRSVDGGHGSCHQRGAVLDFDRRKSSAWCPAPS